MLVARYKLEQQGPVTRILLNHAPFNTLDVPMMESLAATLKNLASGDPKKRPRAVVLGSAIPGQFSQGIDPAAVLSTNVDGRKQIFLALGGLVEALWFLHIPIVADISGPAFAGGAVLAALADFAVIDQAHGKICFSEAKVGLPLPLFVQRLVQRKVNPSSWNDVLLLGRNVDAAEACRIGFANASYQNAGEREEVLQAILGRITRLPPEALSETLRQNRQPERGLLQGFRDNLAEFSDFLTADFLEKGLKAVVKGEAPKF